MRSTADHLDLAPPPQGRWGGALGKAIGVHALLILALTWGVNWKNTADQPAVEAELWAAVPTQAAARAVEPPAPPPPPAPGSAASKVSLAVLFKYPATLVAPATRLRCDSTTPLGLPVLPDV